MSLSPSSIPCDERVSLQLRRLYRQYGYTQYRMSRFEEYEFYARNKSFLVSDRILSFTDTDGKLLALKPDVTLSIVKNRQESGGALQKLYYSETVYRAQAGLHGFREIPQAGLECIGPLDDYAVGEVVELSARSLALIREEYLLELSHMELLAGLLDELGWQEREELLELLGSKNLPAIAALCRAKGVPPEQEGRLLTLAGLYGPPERVLPVLEELAVHPRMAAALDRLRSLCRRLEPWREHVRLDFSIVNDMRYYNGVIFRGYLPGLAEGVLAGGQYDNLLRRLGHGGQAIGFAVYLDQLERCDRDAGEFDVDVLLLYAPDSDPVRVARRARELRCAGRSVRVERVHPPGLRCRECMEVT